MKVQVVEPVVDVGKGGYDEKPFRHSSPRNLTDVFPGRTQNGPLFEVFESGGPLLPGSPYIKEGF